MSLDDIFCLKHDNKKLTSYRRDSVNSHDTRVAHARRMSNVADDGEAGTKGGSVIRSVSTYSIHVYCF